MRSIFAIVSAVAFASSLVFAQPTADGSLKDVVKPRCEACDEACPSNHFYYKPRSCCLQNGGPPSTQNPPSDRGCPATWYWHPTQKCCVPKYSPPKNNPTPSCSTSTFSHWNPSRHCCEHPGGPSGPQPSPQPRHGRRNTHKEQPRHIKVKKSRVVAECPKGLEKCSIASSTDFECVDLVEDLHACGACGNDCSKLDNAVSVSCKPNGLAPSTCHVASCEAGYRPSTDNSKCVSVLVGSPQ